MSMGDNMAFSVLVTTIVFFQGSLALSFERQLTGELLENYCSSARPVKNDSDAVEVKLGGTGTKMAMHFLSATSICLAPVMDNSRSCVFSSELISRSRRVWPIRVSNSSGCS